jgi:hypothetical protein
MRPIAFAGLVLALLPGCDLLGELEAFLSRPTQQELAATALILEGETGCVDVRVRGASSSGSNEDSLTGTDCLFAGSYADFWVLKASSATDIALRLESAVFPPYLALFPVDLQGETALVNEGVVDRNDDGDGVAEFTSRISAGLYVVVVNSAFEGDTGPYALRVQRGVN